MREKWIEMVVDMAWDMASYDVGHVGRKPHAVIKLCLSQSFGQVAVSYTHNCVSYDVCKSILVVC